MSGLIQFRVCLNNILLISFKNRFSGKCYIRQYTTASTVVPWRRLQGCDTPLDDKLDIRNNDHVTPATPNKPGDDKSEIFPQPLFTTSTTTTTTLSFVLDGGFIHKQL
ncbi:hypothetical protein LXL04_039924 [Taraxacum kok-saghyz]